MFVFFFFSSRRRHTRYIGDWSSDVCSSDLRRARQPRARVEGLRDGGDGGGLPLAPGRAPRRRAADPRARARARRARRGPPDRGDGARGAGDPARDGPPRRRADPRAHLARRAQAGHAHPPRGGQGRAARRGLAPARRPMRTVYLGTSEFAADVLDRLAGGPHRPALVVTRPDSRRGRGRSLSPPPVAVRARELGLELIQPDRLHEPEVLERIAVAAPEVL